MKSYDEEFIGNQINTERLARILSRKWRNIVHYEYEQDTGRLYGPDGLLLAIGYAGGDGGNRPDGVNNHKLQNVHNVGPLPCGTYTLGTPVEGSHLGPFAIPLEPDANNEMFGRSGFYCHGDTQALNHSASDGCIILPHHIRLEMWSDECHSLLVYVESE